MSRIEEAIKLLEQIKYLIIEHEGETQYDCNFQGVDKAIKLLESEPEPMVSKEVYDQLHIDFIERGAAIDLLIAENKRLEVSFENLSETLSGYKLYRFAKEIVKEYENSSKKVRLNSQRSLSAIYQRMILSRPKKRQVKNE
jgi:hypothetical protein